MPSLIQSCLLALPLGTAALPSSASSGYALKERHNVPQTWTNVGRASKDASIRLQIGLRQANEGLIEQHLLAVSDPSHERYGQHLSDEDVRRIAAPSDDTFGLVNAWLSEHGISGLTYSDAKDWISFDTTIEKAEHLLDTTYSTFQHWDGSVMVRAPEWSLPAHLHEHIDVVQPTNSFYRPGKEIFFPLLEAHPEIDAETLKAATAAGSGSKSVAALCNVSFTTPDCIRTLYGTIDYVPKVPGKNKFSIANYLNETNKRSDIAQFLETFRPEAAAAAEQFKIITIANASNDQGPYTAAELADGTNVEGNLDAELSLSIGWPTPLTAFSTGGSPPFQPDFGDSTNTNEPYLTFLNFALAQKDLPQVLSSSYGDGEDTVPYSYAKRVCSGFAQLGARGVSVLVSSGDSGVGPSGYCFSSTNHSQPQFLPAFPAGCPWVTAVGATADFNPEVAVSRFGSGAGFSNYFAAPSYQAKTVHAYIKSLDGLYDGLYNKSGRGYPDVAAQGNNDAIVWNGTVQTVGGTSASSPTFAAVLALVNDALIAAGKAPLGFINPWLYAGGYKALTDITSGSSIGCNTSGFPAKKGWDAVTGFGTPNLGKLIHAALEKQSQAPGYSSQN